MEEGNSRVERGGGDFFMHGLRRSREGCGDELSDIPVLLNFLSPLASNGKGGGRNMRGDLNRVLHRSTLLSLTTSQMNRMSRRAFLKKIPEEQLP